MNYYNEFDPFAAAWLRDLIKEKLIPQGDVDERSITEIVPRELGGYTQCHFFAGIGGWSYALQLAEWSEDRPVWTGSCPCQPFSTAGKQKGKADERHLWPVWFELIRGSRPPIVFGEQVPAAIHHGWWDDVADDLEREGYTTRAEIRPACSVGAPHRRDRLWFVADNYGRGRNQGRECVASIRSNGTIGNGRALVNAEHDGSFNGSFSTGDGSAIFHNTQRADCTGKSEGASEPCDVAHSKGVYAQGRENGSGQGQSWRDSQWDGEWIDCPDGKQRLVEPSIRLLVDRTPNRVGKLRGYGNAIVPQVAAEFIKTYKG